MTALTKAMLIELDEQFKLEKDGGRKVEVQFNPETLKVTFANQLVQPQGGDQAAGNGGRQFVGEGTTKLALQLWFDVTAMEKDPVNDVRRLTQQVIYFMTPQKTADPKKLAPPGVRFQWGSFLFDGIAEGMEETLEFFSPDGKPLRASISMTLSQQKILPIDLKGDPKVPTRPGQAPFKAVKQGQSLQTMAGKHGKDDWQGIAAANGVEDPLRMSPGQLVDLNAATGVSGGVGVTGTFGVAAGGPSAASLVPSGAVAGASLNASLGGSVSGSLTIG